MRVTRMIAALVALVLAATMSQALLAPAGAAAKPKHDLKAAGKEIGNTNKFVAHGKVSTFPRGKIKIMRKVGSSSYRSYKKVKTRADGKFSTRIYQAGNNRTCFKVVVPATDVYKRTQKGIGCIVRV